MSDEQIINWINYVRKRRVSEEQIKEIMRQRRYPKEMINDFLSRESLNKDRNKSKNQSDKKVMLVFIIPILLIFFLIIFFGFMNKDRKVFIAYRKIGNLREDKKRRK